MERNALLNQRIVISGAGSAGLGVANSILFCMTQMGVTEEEARKRFWFVDNLGSLGRSRIGSSPAQQVWIRNDISDKLSLDNLVALAKPTILIGLTGVGGIFTETAIKEMAKHVKRPIIFPLSNPTDNAECSAKQAYDWTEGRAVFASGSPFQPYAYGDKTLYPSQANNMFAFPGIGLGAITCEAKMISPRMLNEISHTLAEFISGEDLKLGQLFPRLKDIRQVSENIAFTLCKVAQQEGYASIKFENDTKLRERIQNNMWEPRYGSLVRVDANY